MPRLWAGPDELSLKKNFLRCLHEGHCPLCGDPIAADELHHNSYEHRGHEPLRDLLLLCWRCHPLFEFIRRGGAAQFERAVRELTGDLGLTHASLEQLRECFRADIRHVRCLLAEAEERLWWMRSMVEAGRLWAEGEERRAA